MEVVLYDTDREMRDKVRVARLCRSTHLTKCLIRLMVSYGGQSCNRIIGVQYVCQVSNKNKNKNNMSKLVLERGEFMLVQRVDHLAVPTLVYPNTNIYQLIYTDLLRCK